MNQACVIPTYKVGPNEFVMRMTADQFNDINQGLKGLEQRRKNQRKYAQGKCGKEMKQEKPTYLLGEPIDAAQQ